MKLWQKYIWVLVVLLTVAGTCQGNQLVRSDAHQAYAEQLWSFLNRDGKSYEQWTQVDPPVAMAVGPMLGDGSVMFANSAAKSVQGTEFPSGAVLVGKHFYDGEVTEYPFGFGRAAITRGLAGIGRISHPMEPSLKLRQIEVPSPNEALSRQWKMAGFGSCDWGHHRFWSSPQVARRKSR